MQSKRLFQASEENLINLTPLIDVIFVILIMFMIIAPLVDLDQVALANSGPSKHETQVNEVKGPIQIHVKSNDSIWINKHPVQDKVLVQTLKELKQQHPQVTPVLYHDKRAQFGTYQHLKNSVEQAGFEEMNLVLQPR